MTPVTIEDRKKELHGLLERIRAQPSMDWSEERKRIVVLQEMIAADEVNRERA